MHNAQFLALALIVCEGTQILSKLHQYFVQYLHVFSKLP